MSNLFEQGLIVICVLGVGVFAIVTIMNAIYPTETKCIAGECGFELGCVKEVDVEIKVVDGVRVINQNCILEGWVRDTEYYKGLKEAGYRRADVVFD